MRCFDVFGLVCSFTLKTFYSIPDWLKKRNLMGSFDSQSLCGFRSTCLTSFLFGSTKLILRQQLLLLLVFFLSALDMNAPQWGRKGEAAGSTPPLRAQCARGLLESSSVRVRQAYRQADDGAPRSVRDDEPADGQDGGIRAGLLLFSFVWRR